MTCFKLANKKSFNLIRLDIKLQDSLKSIISSLESSLNSNDFGSKLLNNSLFIQFLIYLNRIYLEDMFISDESALKYDKQIEEILKYINTNISKDLSIEFLAKEFFISKYYLMHKFKKETGYTLHNYILQKRLLIAKDLIENGEAVLKAATKCGFNDYSSFLRSFKKLFNKSPRELFY